MDQDYDITISNEVTEIFIFLCNVFISPIITAVGIVTSIINILVFAKQGMKESINVTFLALAVTDISGLVFNIWYVIGVSPLMSSRTDLSFNSMDVAYVTGAYPRILFTKMTCWITAYASLERCYCIVAPLHVKTMITPRRTFIALAGLYAVGINTSFPLFYTGTVFLEWKTDLLSNRTVLGMGINSHYADVANVTTVLVAVLFFLFFTISVVTTIILTVALHEKSKWRNSLGNCTDKSSKSLAKRDTTIIKTIVLLSLVLIVSYLPYMINCLLVAFLKGFELYGKYYNLYQIMWSVSWLFETMNSSTSLFVYYITSSKFRETFWQIFAKMYSIPGKQQKL